MLRRKLKSMCGLTLAFVLAANMTPVVSYAITAEEESKIDSNSFDESYLRKDDVEKIEERILEGVDTTTEESVSVIVEFVSPSIAEGIKERGQARALSESKIERDHEVFKSFLDDMPSKYNSTGNTSIGYEYKEVFNGVSLNIPGSEIENLLNCTVVKRVHPDTTVQLDLPEKEERNSEGITNLPEGRMGDSVPHIGAEELHNENITGEGIKVGVLDTGIDYNHPDLSNSYKGFRAEDGDASAQDKDSTLGWDFVSNDADPMETTYEDWMASGKPEFDSYGGSFYTSHGTHVSGTIAGRAENGENAMAVKGVAPDVDLYGYRVLGEYGSGSTSGIIAAVEKSVKDGMDVINMSLGSSSGTPFDPLVTAVNNATLAGVVTIIANGNAGPGPSTVGSPATGQLPIAVGASTTPMTVTKHDLELEGGVKLTSANHVVKDFDKTLDDNYSIAYEAVYCGLGKVTDFEGKDLTGKVALVDRGEITFVEKAKNAQDAGAEYVVIMNNTTDTEISPQGEYKGANAIAVNMAEGELIKGNLDENGVTNVTLNNLGKEELKGDEVTGFSSAGPVISTDEIRPDIIAPGYQTFSTVPEYINDKNLDVEDYSGAYGRMNGTSMAAPHVAGVAALILQENPDYTPEDVKAVIMNTSENVNQFRDDEYSVHQQGAGRVNAYEAAHEETHITAEHTVVDGTDHRELTHETGLVFFGKHTKELENPTDKTKSIPFNIENNSEIEKTYNISVKYSLSDRAKNAEDNGVVLDIDNTITVAPNTEVNLEAIMNIPGNADTGIYEGYVVVEDTSNNKDYQLPFAVSYRSAGFEVLGFPYMSGGYGQGISAITSSDLNNRDGSQFGLFADIEIVLGINEKISKVYTFVKDKENGEYLGYAGGDMDASWISTGKQAIISGLAPYGRIQKLRGENITNEHILLESGTYDLEVVAIRPDGSSFKGILPIGILNEGTENDMSVNLEPGVTEVTEDMYTIETWADGNDYEGIWIKGNASHPMVEEIKKEYNGTIEQAEVNQILFEYKGGSGMTTRLPAWSKGDGNFMLAGIERSDLEKGPFVMEGKVVNPGLVSSHPDPYVLINEGESYIEIEILEEKAKTGESFNSKLSLNNVEDIKSGTLDLRDHGNAINRISEIKPTEEFQALLDANNNQVEISFEEIESEGINVKYTTTTRVTFNITGENVVGITGDLDLFDITYTADSLRGIPDVDSYGATFTANKLSGENAELKNTSEEVVDIEDKTISEFISILDREKTVISGSVAFGGYNSDEMEIYALDEEGNRYDATELEGNMYSVNYVFSNLPVIDGEYKVYMNALGHFGAIANVKGGEYIDGELVGIQIELGAENHISKTIEAIPGDVNEDGAVDMHDANILLAELNKAVENRPGYAPDLTQDGVVDISDMLRFLMNYGIQDFNREDVKEPELIVDGSDLIDVLEKLGLFEDGFLGFGIELNKEVSDSLVGETVRFTTDTEADTSYYKFSYYTRKSGEKNWNLAQGESKEPVFDWTPEEAGEYEVKVRALHPSGQTIQDTVTHTVESLDSIVTSPVRDFRATNIEKKKVNVEWTAPENTKGLTGYVLYKDGKKVGEIDANSTSYEFKGLKRHTIYNFKVAAKYANGELSSKESITLRTKR